MVVCKVSEPNSVTYHKQALIFDWSVIRCGSKNKHHNDMCLKEIGLRAQNLLTIQGLVVNIIKELVII